MNLDHPQRRPQKPWTPELERRHVVIESGQASLLGSFLDGLSSRGIVLARWEGDDLWAVREREEETIARHFGLDLDRIEREKLALLRYIRAASAYDEERAAHVARLMSKGKADE